MLKSILRTCQEHDISQGEGGGQHNKEEEQQESKKKKKKKKSSSSSLLLSAELAGLLPEIESLEDRWHQIGLRALEWQYFLEGLAWTEEEEKERREKRNIRKQVSCYKHNSYWSFSLFDRLC